MYICLRYIYDINKEHSDVFSTYSIFLFTESDDCRQE